MRDLTGQHFGELTVVGFDRWHIFPNGAKSARWLCRCSCGTETSIIYTNLIKNTSCGCKMRGVGKSRVFPGRPSWVSYFLNSYLSTCKRTNRVFELTLDEVEHLATSDCHYCGAAPSKRKIVSTEYVVNGIDRKDSSLGYTSDNCVPCCPLCNQMKMDTPYEQFLEQVQRINEHRC